MGFSPKTSLASPTILLMLFVSTKCQRHFLSQRQPIGLSQKRSHLSSTYQSWGLSRVPEEETGERFPLRCCCRPLEFKKMGSTTSLAQGHGCWATSLDERGATDVFLQTRESCGPTSSCILCAERSSVAHQKLCPHKGDDNNGSEGFQ